VTESVPLVGSQQSKISGPTAAVKRALDILVALAGLVICAPVMAVVAVLIKLDSPGSVLFIQPRMGEHGKSFRIYKFRSMVANAEELLDDLVDLDALDEPVFKLKDDPRVTRVGHFLRRWSLDELPQLLNVLAGDMSMVGPRPEEVRVVRYYNGWHRQRLLAKPGVTGPVQVSGRGDLTLEERVQLEIDYINNYSLQRDVAILLRTIPAVIRGDGSY
jgi:lipopolysaccharide/colanic/teichoic acid biosynthesis glycosyltransferase